MSRKKKGPVVSLLTFVLMARLGLALPLPAQNESSSIQEANRLFQAQEWEKAARAYEALTKAEPSNGLAWFRLGLSRHNLQQFKLAIAAFEKADDLGFAPPATRYNLASAHARLGEQENAFAWLEKALGAGFSQVQTLQTDDDLASLREDSRFAEMIKKAEINAAPCEHLEVYRQFDFWVGEWDVFNPNGQQVGTNRIEKVTGGCILLEHWTSASGGSGKSLNYYDPNRNKWVQLWVDSGGGILPIEGTFRDGAMHLSGQHSYRDGRKELFRGQWIPQEDGSVRQLLEQSRDAGRTWYVWFDGKYVRKK